jgi:hypothetical protein
MQAIEEVHFLCAEPARINDCTGPLKETTLPGIIGMLESPEQRAHANVIRKCSERASQGRSQDAAWVKWTIRELKEFSAQAKVRTLYTGRGQYL